MTFSKSVALLAAATAVCVTASYQHPGGAAPGGSGVVADSRDSLSRDRLRPIDIAQPRPALLQNHLYTSIGGVTRQFPLRDGILQPSPVATLVPALDPIAMGPHGGLYVIAGGGPSSGCINPQSPMWQVNLYSTPNLQQLRSLAVACPGGKMWYIMYLDALGVDPQGYLYVGYAAFTNSWRTGIQVYAPFSKGNQLPLLEIQLDGTAATGLAFDAQGALFVSRHKFNDIVVYSNPSKNPQLIRRIHGRPLQSPGALWIDAGELYVACLSEKSHASYVLAYNDAASGQTKPDRQISVAGYPKSGGNEYVAVTGNYLFMEAASSTNHLFEVDKRVNGPQQPIVQSQYNAVSVTVGP